jgi:hypothetical protein
MNGSAVALPLELDPPSGSVPPKANASVDLERAIGTATADAAVVIGQGILDFEVGGALGPRTRAEGGECLARVCKLQLEHFGEIDFAVVARREGKRVLHQRHDATLQAHLRLSAAATDAALDQIIGWVLNITDKVVADERALAH